VAARGKTAGVLEVARNGKGVSARQRKVRIAAGRPGVAGMAVVVALGWALDRWAARPIVRLGREPLVVTLQLCSLVAGLLGLSFGAYR
jgi:branched-subunit amino acid ABC-type transport system permease component